MPTSRLPSALLRPHDVAEAAGEKVSRKHGMKIVARLMAELGPTFDELAIWSWVMVDFMMENHPPERIRLRKRLKKPLWKRIFFQALERESPKNLACFQFFFRGIALLWLFLMCLCQNGPHHCS
jgi:hypothetical protein